MTIESTQPPRDRQRGQREGESSSSGRWAVAVIGFVSLAIVAAIVTLWVYAEGESPATGTPMPPPPKVVVTTQPMPLLSLPSSPAVAVVRVIIREEQTGAATILPQPRSLSIAGDTYPIAAAAISSAGHWDHSAAPGESAQWVPGTTVHPVFGLPASSENTNRLETLSVGASIVLAFENNTTAEYEYTHRESVRADEVANLIAQTRPGLSIVLLGGSGPTRTVLQATYRPDPAHLFSQLSPPDRLEFGAFIVEKIRVSRPAGDPGSGFTQIDVQFTLINKAESPINPSELRTHIVLADARIPPIAPPNGALISPGQSQAVALQYLLPQGTDSAYQDWLISDGAANGLATVPLPSFSEASLSEPEKDVRMVIAGSPSVTANGTGVLVGLFVKNVSTASYKISDPPLLSGSDGAQSLVLYCAPCAPTEISAGKTETFWYTFSRPASGNAELRWLGHRFELSGFP